MVIDVDQEAVFEAAEAGAFDAVALEDDDGGLGGGVVDGRRGGSVEGGSLADALDARQGVVDGGDGVGEDEVGGAAELVEGVRRGRGRSRWRRRRGGRGR